MKIYLFVLCCIFSINSYSQDSDTIVLKNNFIPVRDGYILLHNDSIKPYLTNPSSILNIYSFTEHRDSVFSVSMGKVVRVEKISDEFLCVIVTAKEKCTYTYASLQQCFLKKGDWVDQGKLIGLMGYDDIRQRKKIELIITHKNKKKTKSCICLYEFR